MKQKILLTNGRVIDPLNKVDGHYDVYIAEGKVQAVVHPLVDFEPDFIIDATSYIICPGFVDLGANILRSTHGYDQFQAYLQQALSAGITSLLTCAAMPNRNLEASEILYFSQLSGATHKAAKVYFTGPLTNCFQGNRLAELVLLHEAGCIGFTNGFYPIESSLIKRRCYDYAAGFQFKIFIHPQESSLTPKGGMHEGKISTCLGLPGIPSLAETISLAEELALIEATNVKAHFFHLSSRQSIPFLKNVQKKRLPVTADTSIAHLFLTENEVQVDNGFGNVIPPFRSREDRAFLREAVKENLIFSIASHHTALPKQVKELPFQDAQPGIASWFLFLPLILRFVEEEHLTLSQALATVTHQPAEILEIDAGHLTIGHCADIVIFDPKTAKNSLLNELTAESFSQEISNTGIKYTLVDGQVVYDGS